MNRFFKFLSILLLPILLSSCGDTSTKAPVVEALPTIVSAHSVKESSHLAARIVYPGTVNPEQDVKVNATASGTASGITANLGDSVKAGQILMRIDDSNGSGAGSFNAAQVAQAQLAVDQAKNSLDLAKKNYSSLESSTQKDLDQAKASADQANRNIGHTLSTTDESLKTAELAYETAQLAVDQAKNSLDNRKILATQSEDDAITNAFTTASTQANVASSVLDWINNNTGFDNKNNVSISYKNYLGVLDAKGLATADEAYDIARTAYDTFTAAETCTIASDCVERSAQLLNKTKKAIDTAVNVFEKSISATDFPQTSATGPSVNGLKSSAVNYQAQINAAISQINTAKQSLTNVPLNNKTTIDQLQKSYDLAKKQADSALQNLNNLHAQTNTQKDQIGTTAQSAQSSYESTNLKLQSQLDSGRVQMQQAEIAYQNALLALQNLSNARTITAPIDGTITRKEVAVGDAVNPGQLLFTVSKTGNVKVEMYVDDVHHALMKQGMQADIIDSNKQTFKATIVRIAPQADALTKRFLVELLPNGGQKSFPLAGMVVDISLEINYQPLQSKNFFIPLASITIGQNESSIFTIEKGQAKRVVATIIRVLGEYAEITADIPEDTEIVFDGARSISEGEHIEKK